MRTLFAVIAAAILSLSLHAQGVNPQPRPYTLVSSNATVTFATNAADYILDLTAVVPASTNSGNWQAIGTNSANLAPAGGTATMPFAAIGTNRVGYEISTNGPVVNSLAYGALTNGTDSTSEIQSAVNAAQANGRTVFIPAGCAYTFTSLTNTSGILFIDGEGGYFPGSRVAGQTLSASLPGTASWGSVASTITGWGVPAGPQQNFDQIGFSLRNSVAGSLSTLVRVRVKQTDQSGTLYGDVTVPITTSLGVPLYVMANFVTNIPNTLGSNLWVEILSDARIDINRLDPAPFPKASFSLPQYWINGNVSTPGSGINVVGPNEYNYALDFYTVSTNVGPSLTEPSKQAVNRDSALSSLIIPYYDQTTLQTVTTNSANVYNSSTFSGWGEYIGNCSPFSSVKFFMVGSDASFPVTTVRTRLRRMPTDVTQWTNNPATWTILVDKTISALAPVGVSTPVVVNFGSKTYSGQLWLEWFTDGRTGTRAVSTTTFQYASPPTTCYTTQGAVSPDPTWTAATMHFDFYAETGVGNGTLNSFDLTDAMKLKIPTPTTTTIAWHIPSTLYALEGREMNLYFLDAFRAGVPNSSLSWIITSPWGSMFQDWFRYTPVATNAGSTNFSMSVNSYDSSTLVGSRSATLVTTALSNPVVPVTRKLLIIGDSITAATGDTLAELIKLFSTDTQYTLTEVGSNTGTVNDSGGTPRSVACEAKGGATLAFWYSDTNTAWTTIGGVNRTGSSFVTNGVFSFNYWNTNYSSGMSANDWVIIHLGINDVFHLSSDSAVQAAISGMLTTLSAMITSIQAGVPGIRIGIALTIPPSASQDGFGVNYGVSQTRARYKRNRDLWVETLIATYDHGAVSGVSLVPINIGLDTVNNMQYATASINARNGGSYFQPSNGVHPAATGYYQIADEYAAFLKGNE